MSKYISFILTGRDDGYTGDFIDRFAIALKKNLEILDNHDLDYEIIVVDYNPLEGRLLQDNYKLKTLLQHERVVNIIVDKSVLISEGLYENGFYEYFGKNCAALKSRGKFLFMTNADIIISSETIKYLKEVLPKSDYNNSFYRWRYRQDIHPNGLLVGSPLDLHTPNDVDGEICGGYSGDATLFHRDLFINIATGYNEIDPGHRTPNGQASMDGEILWNLHHLYIATILVDIVYYHVTHPRQAKDSSYSRESYKNNDGWGYSNYPTRKINSNTIEIYK